MDYISPCPFVRSFTDEERCDGPQNSQDRDHKRRYRRSGGILHPGAGLPGVRRGPAIHGTGTYGVHALRQ